MLGSNIEKRLSKLEKNFSKLKNLEKDLNSLSKEVRANSQDLNSQVKDHEKLDADSEKVFRDIKANFREIEIKHKKINKKLQALSAADTAFRQDVRDTKQIAAYVKKTFNVKALSSLRADLNFLADAAESLARQSNSTLKKLSKTNRSIHGLEEFAISSAASAKEAEIKSNELEKYTAELKALAKQYYSKTDAINSKLNAALSSIADLNETIKTLSSQVNAAQNRLALLDRFKEQLDMQRAILSDLKKRVEYIDKACAKTIVLE